MWIDECDKDQQTINRCSKEEFEFYDKKLNFLYGKAMDKLKSKKKNRLQKEQQVWLSNRDSECREFADSEASGDSMWPMFYNNCRAGETIERTLEIKKWLQN